MISSVPLTDPVTRQFLEILASGPGPALHERPYEEARAMAAGLRAAFPQAVEAPPVEIEDTVIPGGPAGDLALRIVRPPNSAGPLPAILFYHGGGWVLCDYSTHARLVCELAAGTGCAVVFVEYSRSPEVRFPVANEEAYFAARYIAENGAAHNLDGSRIAVAGDSAGANMAIAVCLLAKQRGSPAIAGTVLFHPVTGADFDTASYDQFADGYFLTRDSMKWFWDHYLPDVAQRQDPLASPVLATREQLEGFPPTYLMTCECDVLRDEGEAFARNLAEAGVRVTAARYIGAIHACLTHGPLANTPAVRSSIASAVQHLRDVLA